MGPSWAHRGLSEGFLGGLGGQKAVLEDSFTFLSRFGGHLGLIRTVLGLAGARLGPSWVCLEANRACLGEVLGSFWLSGARLGLILGCLGASLAVLQAIKFFFNDSCSFSKCFRGCLGRPKCGTPPKLQCFGSLGEIKRRKTEGIPKEPYSLDAPQGNGWRISEGPRWSFPASF